VVYTLEGDRPIPHPVRVIATDGSRTVIEGEGLDAGMEVLTGLAEPRP
jgi:hypothetical protein